jgi:hypothetical protein
MNQEDKNWKELDKDIELYKFYIEIAIKSAIFVFGITGAIVSYYFSNQIKELMEYSLFVPIILNGGCFFICFSNIGASKRLKDKHYTLCQQVGVDGYYEMEALPQLLYLFSIMYALITIGLLVLLAINIF